MRQLIRHVAPIALACALAGCGFTPTATITMSGYGVTRHEPEGPLVLFVMRNTSSATLSGVTIMASCVEDNLPSYPAVYGPTTLDFEPGEERLFAMLDFAYGRSTIGDGRVTCDFEVSNTSSPPEPAVVLEVAAPHSTPGAGGW